jgi:hypothetical protein
MEIATLPRNANKCMFDWFRLNKMLVIYLLHMNAHVHFQLSENLNSFSVKKNDMMLKSKLDMETSTFLTNHL